VLVNDFPFTPQNDKVQMKAGRMNTDPDPLPWLLEEEDPSVRLRTLTEVLGYPPDSPEVQQAKKAIPASEPVQALLAQMQPDGTWLQTNPRTKRVVGSGVEYGSFGTTHFCLAYLAELGLDRSLPEVEKAAERYLNLQQPDGDWRSHYSCLLGYNIRTFALLGYRDDPRLRRSIDLLLRTVRADGGYLCDWHEGKYRTREVKSCIRGSVKALLAFAEFPELWDHPRCMELVNYFLRRGGIFQSTHPGVPVNADMTRLSYPITWRANGWEVLHALSRMGLGGDEWLQAAWGVLEARADANGRYPLDWTPTFCPWKVGEKGKPSKWITFYVQAAKKYAV
jgi:hypothetical protein